MTTPPLALNDVERTARRLVSGTTPGNGSEDVDGLAGALARAVGVRNETGNANTDDDEDADTDDGDSLLAALIAKLGIATD